MKNEVVGKVFTNEMLCNARMFEFALNENVWHETNRTGNICPWCILYLFIMLVCFTIQMPKAMSQNVSTSFY